MEFLELFELAKIAVLVLVGGMAAAVIGVLRYKEGLIEVNPMRAVVVRNIWTSKPRALLETDFITPGWEKKLREVTLENEPSDPPIMKALTQDGTEIGIDLVISTQKIKEYPDDKDKARDAVVKAATKIDYDKRAAAILNRIKIYAQDALVCCTLEDIVEGGNEDREKEKDKGKRAVIERIENTLKEKLPAIENEWGFEVIAEVRNLELPEKAQEVAEESATAEQEGKRIKTKADAAGVDPKLIVIGDILYDAIRAVTASAKGGKS